MQNFNIMANIIFRAPRVQRFKAPKATARQCWAMILYKLTGLKTTTYKAAVKAYRAAWREHAERLQAELDAEHSRAYYIDGRTGKLIYK